MHLKYAYFVRWAETVLDAAQQAVRVIAFAFQVEDGISDMFQSFGTGDSAFLGDMSNDEDRNMRAFGQLHQLEGAFAHLADAPRSRGDMAGKDGLNRVDDHQGRFQTANRVRDH